MKAPFLYPLVFTILLLFTCGDLLAEESVCLEGQVDTSGHCCWPGQRFAFWIGRCLGEPICPEGRISLKGGCQPISAQQSEVESSCSEDPVSCLSLELANIDDPEIADKQKRRLIGLACQNGEKEACLLHARSMVEEHRAKSALPLMERLCQEDFPPACTEAGELLLAGQGVERATEEAFLLLARGCELGHSRGCIQAGDALRRGRYYEQDNSRAASFFTLACEAGAAEGCVQLALHLWSGLGVDWAPVDAYDSLERLCKHHQDALACTARQGIASWSKPEAPTAFDEALHHYWRGSLRGWVRGGFVFGGALVDRDSYGETLVGMALGRLGLGPLIIEIGGLWQESAKDPSDNEHTEPSVLVGVGVSPLSWGVVLDETPLQKTGLGLLEPVFMFRSFMSSSNAFQSFSYGNRFSWAHVNTHLSMRMGVDVFYEDGFEKHKGGWSVSLFTELGWLDVWF